MRSLLGARNDRAVLRDFYERYAPSVHSRCMYLLKDRSGAEDATHDVFAKALQHLGEKRSDGSALSWLLGIATNHCLNVIRAQGAHWREEVERRARLMPVGSDGVRHMERRDLVRLVLARFDAETQAVAVHYYVDEMTLDEVATVVGRSVPTVRKRLATFAEAARREIERLESDATLPGAKHE